jgi:hypothetical protein
MKHVAVVGGGFAGLSRARKLTESFQVRVTAYIRASSSQIRITKNDEWRAALDKIQFLKPRTVVAGHKNPKNDDNAARVIGPTRPYILDFQELAGKTATAKEL